MASNLSSGEDMDTSLLDDDDDNNVDMGDIKKNLMDDLEDSPTKPPPEGFMPPPPVPPGTDGSNEKMKIFLRIRPLNENEKAKGENQVNTAL